MKILFDQKLFDLIRIQVVEDDQKNQFVFVHDGTNKRKFESIHLEHLPASVGTNRHVKSFLKKSMEIAHKKTGEPISELQKDISFKRTRDFILSNN